MCKAPIYNAIPAIAKTAKNTKNDAMAKAIVHNFPLDDFFVVDEGFIPIHDLFVVVLGGKRSCHKLLWAGERRLVYSLWKIARKNKRRVTFFGSS